MVLKSPPGSLINHPPRTPLNKETLLSLLNDTEPKIAVKIDQRPCVTATLRHMGADSQTLTVYQPSRLLNLLTILLDERLSVPTDRPV